MSTITKEWLQKAISQHESMRDEIPFGLDEDDSNTLAALRIALASLEAEPAIHRWRRVTVEPYGPYPWHYGNFIGFSKPVEGIEDEYYYSAPPVPVSVPDEVSWEDVPEEITEDDMALASAWAHGFNQFRAAMLQGADGNSPVIAKAYDIEAFGVFSATEGKNGLLLQIEQFWFGTENCPQIGKENMVPKFALQAIINRLQAHCNSMGEDTLIDIFASSAAPQQEDK